MNKSQSSESYQKVKNYLFFISLAIDFAILYLFFISGLSVWLKDFALRFAENFFLVNALYLALFCLGMYVLHFPMSFFSGYYWEHRFELSNQTFHQWLYDDVKKAGLTLIVVMVLAEMIYAFLSAFSQSWWIWAGCVWLFLMFVIAKIVPNVIVPLFYKYSFVEDEDLKQRIRALFARFHVPLDDVYTIDFSTKTKKANAMLCGLGRNRRVVLSDTLIEHFNADEIEAVVAHEMGHLKHHDIFKLLAINAVTIFCGLFLVHQYLRFAIGRYGMDGIADISFLPMLLIVFMLFGLITTPLINFFSRWVEKQADVFSLQATDNREAFIAVMKKLGELNLAEYKPGRFTEIFLYDHPPLYRRIQMAEAFKATEQRRHAQ